MILPGFLLCARHGVDLEDESSPRALMTGTVCRLVFLPTSASVTNVAFWLQADIQPPEIDVCFTPKSGHSEAHAGLPLLTQTV